MSTRRRDLLAALAPVTKALRKVETEAATQEGITMWQYAILAVVAQTPGLNQGEVAHTLGYSPNRIISDLDVLEQRDLLKRIPGADRRSNILTITAAGTRLMRRVQADIHRGEDQLLAPLPVRHRRSLVEAAHALADALRESDSRASS